MTLMSHVSCLMSHNSHVSCPMTLISGVITCFAGCTVSNRMSGLPRAAFRISSASPAWKVAGKSWLFRRASSLQPHSFQFSLLGLALVTLPPKMAAAKQPRNVWIVTSFLYTFRRSCAAYKKTHFAP